MSDSNPYSPPTAVVSEPVSPRVPRALIALLAIYFLVILGGNLYEGNLIGLVLPAIMGLAAWRTLKGSRAASRYLGGLFVLGALMSAWSAYGAWGSNRVATAVMALTALYMAVVAWYIFLSPGMQALYTQGDRARWTDR